MKLLALTLAALGADARMSFGKCPSSSVAGNFDKSKFAGNWYEISRDADFFFEMGHECTTQQFTAQDDGSMNLYFRAWMWQMLGYSGVNGNARKCGDGNNYTCMISMKDKNDWSNPYDILYINDDHTVAVNYMCSEMFMGMATFQWWSVISKSQTISSSDLADAYGAITDANLGYSGLGARMTQ